MTGVKGVSSHSDDFIAKSIKNNEGNKENVRKNKINEEVSKISGKSIPINGNSEKTNSLRERKLSLSKPGKLQEIIDIRLDLGKNRRFDNDIVDSQKQIKIKLNQNETIEEETPNEIKSAIDKCFTQLKNHNNSQNNPQNNSQKNKHFTPQEIQVIQNAITQKITGKEKSTNFKLAHFPSSEGSHDKDKDVWVSFNKSGEPKLIILYQNKFLTSGGMSDVYNRGSCVEKVPKFNEAAVEDVIREAKTIKMLVEKYPEATSFIDATLIETETGPHLLVEFMDGGDLTKIGLGVFHQNIEKMEKFANTYEIINKLGTDLKSHVEANNYTQAKEKIEAIRHHIKALQNENLPVECAPYCAKDLSTMLDKLKVVENKLNELQGKNSITPSSSSSSISSTSSSSTSSLSPSSSSSSSSSSTSSATSSTQTSSSTSSLSPSSSTSSLAGSLNPDTPRGISALNNQIEKDFCKKALDLKAEMEEGAVKGNKIGKAANSAFNPEKLNKKKLFDIARNVLEGHVLMGMAGLHHRDIKLENILVKINDSKQEIDYIRLADFGTASSHNEVDIANPVEGTKLYTSQNGANQLGEISEKYRALNNNEAATKNLKLTSSQAKREGKIESLEQKIRQRNLDLVELEKSLNKSKRKEGEESLGRLSKLKIKIQATKNKLNHDQKTLESEKQKLNQIKRSLVSLNKNTAGELFDQYNEAVAKEDVYALGLTLFQILTQGRYPYGEVYSSGASAQRFKEKENPYRSELLENLGYPKSLTEAIKNMVDHDPKKRPKFSELNAVFQGLPRSL